MERCSSTRILIGTTVFFIVTTVVLVGILVWRETKDDRDGGVKEEITISEKTVSKVYPGIFKTTEEQKELFDRYTSSFYYNRTAVTERFKSSIQCALICGEGSFASRRKKRVAGDNNIYHGCCMSNVTFTAPRTIVNYYGRMRTVLQYPRLKQFFTIHHCSQMEGCVGCSCSQEESLYSAVVQKYDETEAEHVEDTEIDFFFLKGCCKCVNI